MGKLTLRTEYTLESESASLALFNNIKLKDIDLFMRLFLFIY